MSYRYRVIAPDEYDAFLRIDAAAFGLRYPPPTDRPDSWSRGELDRAFGAFDGAELVGIGRNYSFELTLPGGAIVPVAAVSWIGVAPTHRRRGITRGMLDTLHRDAVERGEVASVLTATEGGIYGRFGYGPATWRQSVRIDRSGAAFDPRVPAAEGQVRLVPVSEAPAVVAPIYDVARRQRAGAVSRPPFWWPQVYDRLAGEDAAFVAVHRDAAGVDDAFALYTVTGDWDDQGIPAKTCEVKDVIATSAAGHAGLWRYLCGLDLVRRIEVWHLAVDDPLRFLLADPRQVRVDALHDQMWLRLHDPVAFFGARALGDAAPVVVDADGVRLRLGGDGVSAVDATVPAAVTLSLGDLGAISLGGTSAVALAAAGRVVEAVPGAAARLDDLLRCTPAPATLSGM